MPAFIWLAASVGFASLLSRALYLIYRHPLANIPGSKLAALSTWYEAYYDLFAAPAGRLPWQIASLHKKYGPIIRIGPNEVHIDDVEFVSKFFSSSSTVKRDKHAPHQQQLGVPDAVVSTIPSSLHEVRRSALAPFLSSTSINSRRDIILAKIENVSARLQACKDHGEAVNLRQLFWYMASDIISDIAFPSGLCLLENPILDAGHYNFQKKGQGKLLWFKHFPFLWVVLKRMPPSWLLRLDPQAAVPLNWETRNKILAQKIMSGDSASEKVTVFHHLLASSLPAPEKKFDRVWQDAASLVGAGGETVSNTLCVTIFHLLSNPTVLSRLVDELRIAIPDPSDPPPISVLGSLPYLSAVVQEGLRKAVGIISRFIRVDPNGFIKYRSYNLPPGTAISMSTLLVHNNPEIFPNPEKFIPERWMNTRNQGLRVEDKRMMMAFGGGPRKCLGMHLAQAEIYLTLAVLFRRFEFESYETTVRDVEPMYDSLMPLPWEGSKGVRVMVK
ncbi:hypothetical protein G7Y89_g4252 [Cudoniella acicularis]|uniref:Cytochrome P450 n=1 Tax=Cudoniella acicularis TaxID=354080 RepID=A0A8H4W4H0_9HELO|nr:hypothetical protein G7Y89_g4252 [Cudoniella acicularis]